MKRVIKGSRNGRLIKEIQDDILNAASELLQSPEFGFPLSYIADYLFVDISELDDMLRIEVRCELSYSGMSKLAGVLDEVVREYDDNAYFDFVDPGIIEAYVPIPREIEESTDIESGLNVKFILNTLEKAAEAVNKYGDLIELIRKVSRIYPEAAKKYRKMARDFKENPRELAKDILKDMESLLLEPVESSILPAIAKGLATHAVVDEITSEEYLDPPEDTRTIEDGIEKEIKFHLDEIIEVDDAGNWDFVEDEPKSFINPDSSDGSWYFDEYSIEMCDPQKLNEDTGDVIYMEVPAQAGRYRINADMVMYYYTDDLYVTEDRYPDEDGDVVRDIIDVDVNVYFDEKGSYHKNLEIQSV